MGVGLALVRVRVRVRVRVGHRPIGLDAAGRAVVHEVVPRHEP